MLEEAIFGSNLAFGNPGFVPDEQRSSTQPNDRSCQMLIKKKDVNDYFAARRARHPLGVKQASALAATRSSNVKRASKASTEASIDAPGSSAATRDSDVTPCTSQRGLIDAPQPVVDRWTKL
jgi:hypothetical protein